MISHDCSPYKYGITISLNCMYVTVCNVLLCDLGRSMCSLFCTVNHQQVFGKTPHPRSSSSLRLDEVQGHFGRVRHGETNGI